MINLATFYNNHYPSDFVNSLIPSSTPGDWRERGTVKVRHLAQAHDAMIQLGFRNHTYSPQVQCTDNKATESPTSKMRGGGGRGTQKNRMVRKKNFKMKG